MKKLLSFILISLMLVSCSKDIDFGNIISKEIGASKPLTNEAQGMLFDEYKITYDDLDSYILSSLGSDWSTTLQERLTTSFEKELGIKAKRSNGDSSWETDKYTVLISSYKSSIRSNSKVTIIVVDKSKSK